MRPTLVMTAAASIAGAAGAQQVRYDGALWPPAGQTDPTRAPGDMVAPPASTYLKRPGATPGPTPPPVTTPRLPNDLSLTAAEAAIAACATEGRAVAAAITDAEGVLQLGLSAPGAAPPGRVYASVQKAAVAVAFGKPSSVVREEMRAAPARIGEVKPNMMLLAGGLPIRMGGRLVGAIGVSGGTSVQDERCARAGLASIADRLR